MFKIIKFVIFALISTTLFIGYGCQQEAVMEQDYSDAPYLSLPSGTDFNNLTDAEIEIIMEAFSRMGIHEDEDGLLALKPRSGWEVNISENIYRFFRQMIRNSNNQITSDVSWSRASTLSNGETPGEYRTDCLARSITAALGPSAPNDIDAWIRGQYGDDGVPPEKVRDVLNHFLMDE